jgi:hypothetical protein
MPCPAFNSAGFEIKRSSQDTDESGLQNAIETLRDRLSFAWTIARGRRGGALPPLAFDRGAQAAGLTAHARMPTLPGLGL